MPSCAVKKCKNNTRTRSKRDGVTFHHFPSEEPMREKWRIIIAKERQDEYFLPNQHTVVCSRHFLECDTYTTEKGYRRLTKWALPHIEDDDTSRETTKSSRKRKLSKISLGTSTTGFSQQPIAEAAVNPSGGRIKSPIEAENDQSPITIYGAMSSVPPQKPGNLERNDENTMEMESSAIRNAQCFITVDIYGAASDSTPVFTEPPQSQEQYNLASASQLPQWISTGQIYGTASNSTEVFAEEKENPEQQNLASASQLPQWLSTGHIYGTFSNLTQVFAEENENPEQQDLSSAPHLQQSWPSESEKGLSSGLSSVLNTPRKNFLQKELKKCHRKLYVKNKQIRNLRKQNKRLLKKNASMRETLQDLKKKRLVDDTLYNDLKDTDENVMKILSANKKQKFSSYPPVLRKFALTLHFYSPAAYQYLRRVFHKCLPHPSTLFRWYQNVHAQPGFTAEAMERLAEKSKQTTTPLICALVADEMAIRQQKIWTGSKFEGLVDLGINCDDSEERAIQAFVFLIVSLTEGWTLPIAYFFIQQLSGDMKAQMITIALQKCHDVGVKIVSLTFDGCKSNINCMKALGCNLDDHANIKSTFEHPSDNQQKVAVFLDACHMVKLMRNHLEAKKEFQSGTEHIKWSYIEDLHNLQQECGLNLANKLSHRHIYFRNEIMKVKLATQLFSESVAKAIQFCNQDLKIQEFSESEATVKFLKTMNDIFDILNTKNLRDFGLKKPLDSRNSKEVLSICAAAKKQLLSLTTKVSTKKTIKVNGNSRTIFSFEVRPLHECKANTGVIGLLTCINSLEHLYATLVETGILSYLMTYKCSQDHLELFFGKVRSLGGFNNNPNTLQFKAAYKKLLAHLELSTKFSGNCLPLENYPILSGSKKINETASSFRHEDETEETVSKMSKQKQKIDTDTENTYTNNCGHLSSMLDSPNPEVTNQIVGYISGFVVYHLLKNLKCDDCKNHLLATQKMWFHKLVDLKNIGGLCFVSQEVFSICNKTENLIRIYHKASGGNTIHKLYDKKYITVHVLKDLGNVRAFNQIDAHTRDQFNHIYDLTKAVIEKYVDVRLHYICKNENINAKRSSKRQVFNKLTLFQGA